MRCTQLYCKYIFLKIHYNPTAQCTLYIFLITHYAVHRQHIEHRKSYNTQWSRMQVEWTLDFNGYNIPHCQFPKSSRWCPNPVPVGKSTALGGQSFIPNLSGPIYFSFVSRAQWPNLFFIYLPRGHGSGLELACYLIHHQGYLKAISTVPCHGLI